MIDPDIKRKFEQLFTNVELRPWAQRVNMRGTIDPYYRLLMAQCKEDDKWYQVEAKMPVSDYLKAEKKQTEQLDRADEQLMLRLIEVAAKEKKERRDARKPS